MEVVKSGGSSVYKMAFDIILSSKSGIDSIKINPTKLNKIL